MNSNTHPANLDIVKTKIQRWTQNQIKSVDDDVEDHIKQIRESNGTFEIFFRKNDDFSFFTIFIIPTILWIEEYHLKVSLVVWHIFIE